MSDVVYYVRPGDRNEELRFSLRSLRNLPHERVWIVGHKPDWVQGVEHIPGNRKATPMANAVDNLLLACDAVPADSFVVMNDDFYVMEPITTVPAWHDGPLAQRVRHGTGYMRTAMQRLAEAGYAEPLAWTLHIPLVVLRPVLRAILDLLDVGKPPEWRTMYGNLAGVHGERHPDVKVRSRGAGIPDGPFLSSSDSTFPWLRGLLEGAFPEPSRYEAQA